MASLAVVVGVSASSAFAGEVNGKGDPVPATDHAASECAFSGLNDEYYVDGDTTAPRTQTPKDGPPGAPGHGVFIPGIGFLICRGNA
jgi:hypothetical protein